jgi:hypothetical protein
VSRKAEEESRVRTPPRRNRFARLRHRAAAVAVLNVVFAWASAGTETAPAQAPAAHSLAGAPEGLRATWDRTYSIALPETTLRRAIDRLATVSGMTAVLDRRVDPDRPVTLDARDLPLGQIWTHLAANCGLSVSWVGPVVYLGPPEAAAELRTLSALRRAEVANLPTELRSALATKKAVAWPDLEEPRSLLASWSAEAGLRSAGDGMPHDLWPAARWPALSLVDRLTLLAIGFDRTFAVDPALRTLTLTPIPDVVAIERTYPAPPNAADTVRRWQGLAPQASVRLVGSQLVVVGREEDHEAIATGRARSAAPIAVAPAPSSTAPSKTAASSPANARVKPPAGTRVFTMRALEKPLSAIVDALRSQGSDVLVDDAALKRAGIDPAGRTSVEVKDATLAELLEAAGKPLGLTVRQVGKAVELVPRP